jgi:hypothetical protein
MQVRSAAVSMPYSPQYFWLQAQRPYRIHVPLAFHNMYLGLGRRRCVDRLGIGTLVPWQRSFSLSHALVLVHLNVEG